MPILIGIPSDTWRFSVTYFTSIKCLGCDMLCLLVGLLSGGNRFSPGESCPAFWLMDIVFRFSMSRESYIFLSFWTGKSREVSGKFNVSVFERSGLRDRRKHFFICVTDCSGECMKTWRDWCVYLNNACVEEILRYWRQVCYVDNYEIIRIKPNSCHARFL